MNHGPHGGLRRVATILGIAVAAALVWVLATVFWLWRHQERVVFQPPGRWAPPPASAHRADFPAADGHPLHGYIVAPQGGGAAIATVIIAFHGNADLAIWLLPWAGELARRSGATVFVPEYRGYAGITGRPTYESAGADALGALRFAQSLPGASRVVLFGHSLGSAIASELAVAMPAPPAALVLQSPFTSAREMAARMLVPPIPGLWRRIARVHYDTRAVVAALEVPVHVAHGTRDVVIPTRMGRAVHDAARRPGALLIVPGAGHNDVADVGGEDYWRWLVGAVSASVGELEEEGDGRLPGFM